MVQKLKYLIVCQPAADTRQLEVAAGLPGDVEAQVGRSQCLDPKQGGPGVSVYVGQDIYAV